MTLCVITVPLGWALGRLLYRYVTDLIPDKLRGYPIAALAGSAADKTEVRFEVETEDRWTTRWLDWARAQQIDREWLDTLVRVGGGMEAAERWLISFKEIPSDRWVRVENVRSGKELWSR